MRIDGFTIGRYNFAHGIQLKPEEILQSGDRLVTSSQEEKISSPLVQDSGERRFAIHIRLNGVEMDLPSKKDGVPYYLMDLLEYSGLDFEHLERPVALKVNGQNGLFQQEIKTGDDVEISVHLNDGSDYAMGKARLADVLCGVVSLFVGRMLETANRAF